MALERGIGTKSMLGLADLSALVLKRHLDKPSDIRVSEAWEDDELSPAQVEYAALDALAGLQLYDALILLPLIPSNHLPSTSLCPNSHILLLQHDSTVPIARGIISRVCPPLQRGTPLLIDTSDIDPPLHALTWSKSRAEILVTEVLVPGAFASEYSKYSKGAGKTLAEFGDVSFHLVVKHVMLRIDIPPFSVDSCRFNNLQTPESPHQPYDSLRLNIGRPPNSPRLHVNPSPDSPHLNPASTSSLSVPTLQLFRPRQPQPQRDQILQAILVGEDEGTPLASFLEDDVADAERAISQMENRSPMDRDILQSLEDAAVDESDNQGVAEHDPISAAAGIVILEAARCSSVKASVARAEMDGQSCSSFLPPFNSLV